MTDITESVTKTGFEWDLALNQLEEEVVYTDDPDPIIALIDHIRISIPSDCAADEEDEYGKFPTHMILMPTTYVTLLNEVLEDPDA